VVKGGAVPADNAGIMTIPELLDLIVAVIQTRDVIIVTVVIAIYVNIVVWIVRYRKRPAGSARRRRAPLQPIQEKPSDSGDDDED